MKRATFARAGMVRWHKILSADWPPRLATAIDQDALGSSRLQPPGQPANLVPVPVAGWTNVVILADRHTLLIAIRS